MVKTETDKIKTVNNFTSNNTQHDASKIFVFWRSIFLLMNLIRQVQAIFTDRSQMPCKEHPVAEYLLVFAPADRAGGGGKLVTNPLN